MLKGKAFNYELCPLVQNASSCSKAEATDLLNSLGYKQLTSYSIKGYSEVIRFLSLYESNINGADRDILLCIFDV